MYRSNKLELGQWGSYRHRSATKVDVAREITLCIFPESWEQTRYFNMSNDGNAFELGVNMDTEVAMVAVGTGKKRYNDD